MYFNSMFLCYVVVLVFDNYCLYFFYEISRWYNGVFLFM